MALGTLYEQDGVGIGNQNGCHGGPEERRVLLETRSLGG